MNEVEVKRIFNINGNRVRITLSLTVDDSYTSGEYWGVKCHESGSPYVVDFSITGAKNLTTGLELEDTDEVDAALETVISDYLESDILWHDIHEQSRETSYDDLYDLDED